MEVLNFQKENVLLIFTLLAERLGIKDDYTEGKSAENWARAIFNITGF